MSSPKKVGLALSKSPIVTVKILSQKVQKALDNLLAKDLFDNSSKATAERFKNFWQSLGPGASETAALMIFNIEEMEEGRPPVTMNFLKLGRDE